MFSFLKKKLLAISELKLENDTLKEEISALQKKVDDLSRVNMIDKIESEIIAANNTLLEIKDKYVDYCMHYESTKNDMERELSELEKQIRKKKGEVMELDDILLLHEFGLYKPVYMFTSSEQYKEKLYEVRKCQKDMILSGNAAISKISWLVDNSRAKGDSLTKQNIKQIIRCFNVECDSIISKVKFNNFQLCCDKISRSFDSLNRLNNKNAVALSSDFLELKLQELHLVYEYAEKKQAEKEEQRKVREQQREEAMLQKEIEERREEISKEKNHYENALNKLISQMQFADEIKMEYLTKRKIDLEEHISELQESLNEIDYREANKKAGYVYIISNIGSFGENIYKIGMTRRLDPMDRINELGDASVPFKFDVHALIFSDNAPQLETALHKAFENKKVNMINGRREFFNVSLDEIEKVVKENYDKTVDFIYIAEAQQYRESLKMRKLNN